LFTILAFATPAHAEGGFDTYVYKVMCCFESRTWTDKNIDSASTTVNFQNCTFYLNGTRTSPRNVGT
jgi:hypothetical protein